MYYSALQRAVEGAKQNKATPQQWLALPKKLGVKPDEIEWLGVEHFLGTDLDAGDDKPLSLSQA